MKKLILLIMSISPLIVAHAQDYFIIFEGSGAATTIDSILVHNLTKNSKVTIYGIDSLHLSGNLFISQSDNDKVSELLIFPNPTNDNTIIQFETQNVGEAIIEITDASGRYMINTRDAVSPGLQQYTVNGLEAGFYTVLVRVDNNILKTKFISNSRSGQRPLLKYLGTADKNKTFNKFKNTDKLIDMLYSDGEWLLLKAYSGNYVTYKTLLPTQSHVVTIDFESCTDDNNNDYAILQVGDQTWMAQNLNTGTMISGTNNQTDNDIMEKYCYDDLETNCNVYGGLYQWNELMQYVTSEVAQGICPGGWHIPSETEWTIMAEYLEGYFFAGGKLKETDTIHWKAPNMMASNTSGFTALPGGYLGSDMLFTNLGLNGNFWSSSNYDETFSWRFFLTNTDPSLGHVKNNVSNGLSVRCIKGAVSNVQLLVSPQNRNVSKEPGTTTFSIESNTSWIVEENVSWLSAIPVNGTNDCTITITYESNPELEERIGDIKISALNDTTFVIVTVTQFGLWTCGNAFTDDRDGKLYNTVQIGSQCWMAQNLNFGTMIDGINDQTNNGLVEKYCYNNLETNCVVHGGLYQWDEMMQYQTLQGIQGICPFSWHLSTDVEWYFMTNFIDPSITDPGQQGWIGTDIGYNLITEGTSGFNALFSGERWWDNGEFINLEYSGHFWTSSLESFNDAYYRKVVIGNPQLARDGASKLFGASVRCVKDIPASSWNCGDTLFDERDGKNYKTAMIGTQCWMAENLNFGSRIDGINNQTNNGIDEKYCYDDLERNCDINGGLYQWNELMGYSTINGAQGVCPEGWHVATDIEWYQMTNYLDLTVNDPNYQGWIGTDIGTKLVVGGSSGFDALFSGERWWDNGEFMYIDYSGHFWSSTAVPSYNENSWYRKVVTGNPQLARDGASNLFGASVRCIKGVSSAQLAAFPENINVSKYAGSTTFSIESNVSWTVEENESWLFVTPMNGTNNALITVNYDTNTNTTSRIGEINVSADTTSIDVIVTLTQEGTWVCGETLTDVRDNKIYNTIQIGSQCWMAQNINFGVMIDGFNSQTNNEICEKYCYNDLEANCEINGGLYQWSELMNYQSVNGAQGVCPGGWHVATDMEWFEMTSFLDPSITNPDISGWIGTYIGYQLIPGGSSGFDALFSGERWWDNGNFINLGISGHFWTSTMTSSSNALYRKVLIDNPQLARDGANKLFGASVRCIKD